LTEKSGDGEIWIAYRGYLGSVILLETRYRQSEQKKQRMFYAEFIKVLESFIK
jgi:hypothetical protein